VIVAIDEKSLSQLGGWPWRRTLHAELLKACLQRKRWKEIPRNN